MVSGILESKKASFILVWSAIIHAFYVLPFVRENVLPHSIIYKGFISGVILVLYPLSGWLVDVYFTRYRAMLAGLGAVIIGTTMSTIFGFLLPEAVLGGFFIVRVGYWLFEVSAIMYGFEQLEAYNIENHRVFIYWFYWTLEIGHFMYGLCVCISAQFEGAITGGLITSAVFGSIQVVAMVIVAIIMLFKRHKFGDTRMGYHPLCSILKALRHMFKKPFGLKNLYLENGGLFSQEVVTDVRVFLYIMFVICPLSIVYFTEEIYTVATQFRPDERNVSEPFHQCLVTEVPTWIRSAIAMTFIPIYLLVLTPLVTRIAHYRSLLLRMGAGLGMAFLSVVSLFGIELTIYLKNREDYSLQNACVHHEEEAISFYWLLIPELLNGLSAVVVFSTTLEFICAQSTSGVRGLLIAVWFALDGLNQVFVSTQRIWQLDCFVYYYVAKLVVVFVFLIIFMFALKMYTTRNIEYSSAKSSMDSSVDQGSWFYRSIGDKSDDSSSYNVNDSALSYIAR